MSQQKTLYCNTCKANGVTTEIFFSNAVKSTSGKCIPLERSTNNKHSCPFRQQNAAAKPTVQAVVPTQTANIAGANAAAILSKLDVLEQAVKRIEQAVASLLITAPQVALQSEQENE